MENLGHWKQVEQSRSDQRIRKTHFISITVISDSALSVTSPARPWLVWHDNEKALDNMWLHQFQLITWCFCTSQSLAHFIHLYFINKKAKQSISSNKQRERFSDSQCCQWVVLKEQRLGDQTRFKHRCSVAEGNQVNQWQVSRGNRCSW